MRERDGEVAYVLMGFPRLSESFISNEIVMLESFGLKLRLFAVKKGEDARVHESVGRIRAPLTVLPPVTRLSSASFLPWLRTNFPAYRAAHARLLRARPFAYLATLARAAIMCVRYRHRMLGWPRKVFIREFLQAGYIAAELLDRPQVRHLHGHFCHGATTITWHVARLLGLPFSFTAHAKDIYQVEQNPGNLLERKLGAAQFVTTCTTANCHHLHGNLRHGERVRTVYHGLDTTFFSREAARSPAPEQPPRLLAVGRFVEKKGLLYLVRACALLRDAELEFRCTLLGEPGDELERIREEIRLLDLGSVVELRGMVTHEVLREIYAAASIFVLPCVVAADGDRDGIPNVMAEAMAMSVPVVTTAVSGITEIVRHDENGLIVPERDASALAATLERLLRSPALRQRIGTAARRTILEKFDAAVTNRELLRLFRAQLNGTSPAAEVTAAEVRS
ncbi:MAG: glycosyltransferase [Steroidobacteraceae bacterium]